MQIHDHDRVLCRQYMMEEVGLRLVFEEDITSVKQASMKISQLDASQFKDRTPAEMVQKLFDVYTRNNSDIVQYSPSFETVLHSLWKQLKSEVQKDPGRRLLPGGMGRNFPSMILHGLSVRQ